MSSWQKIDYLISRCQKKKVINGNAKLDFQPRISICFQTVAKEMRIWNFVSSATEIRQTVVLIWTSLKINRCLLTETNNVLLKFWVNILIKFRKQNLIWMSDGILKMTSAKINIHRLLPIDTSKVLLNFGVDTRSQTKVKVREKYKIAA